MCSKTARAREMKRDPSSEGVAASDAPRGLDGKCAVVRTPSR